MDQKADRQALGEADAALLNCAGWSAPMLCGSDIKPCRSTTVTIDHLGSLLAAVLMLSVATGLRPATAQSSPEQSISLSIPAQPLSRALIAYGAATGFEIFYKSVLAERRRSTEVVGALTPSDALRRLLEGTGYVARISGPGELTIEEAPRDAAVSATDASVRRRLEPYFAAIQERISDVLCQKAGLPADSHDVLVQFWIETGGAIARAEVLTRSGEPASDQTVASAMRGLRLAAPPVGMPQPISMVIFPPSSRLESCAASPTQRRAG